jgi:hypothetical protein
MPIRLFDGVTISDLEQAVTTAETTEKVVQIIGQYGGRWALLTEKRPGRPPVEKRGGK